jgi:hypothetical protein
MKETMGWKAARKGRAIFTGDATQFDFSSDQIDAILPQAAGSFILLR